MSNIMILKNYNIYIYKACQVCWKWKMEIRNAKVNPCNLCSFYLYSFKFSSFLPPFSVLNCTVHAQLSIDISWKLEHRVRDKRIDVSYHAHVQEARIWKKSKITRGKLSRNLLLSPPFFYIFINKLINIDIYNNNNNDDDEARIWKCIYNVGKIFWNFLEYFFAFFEKLFFRAIFLKYSFSNEMLYRYLSDKSERLMLVY